MLKLGINTVLYKGFGIKSALKAIKLAGDNEVYAPTFMLKKATVLHAQKKYADEVKIYETIRDKYPQYAQVYQVNMDKYIERAKAMAGE